MKRLICLLLGHRWQVAMNFVGKSICYKVHGRCRRCQANGDGKILPPIPR